MNRKWQTALLAQVKGNTTKSKAAGSAGKKGTKGQKGAGPGGKRGSGGKKGTGPGGKVAGQPSPGTELGHKGRGPILGGIPGATVDEYLAVSAETDLAAATAIEEEMRKTGLPEVSGEEAQAATLSTDAASLEAATTWPPGCAGARRRRRAGSRRRRLRRAGASRGPCAGFDRVLEWAQGRIQVGRWVLEKWQAEGQATIASAFLVALAMAATEDEYVALIEDGDEVLALEAKKLADAIVRAKANAAGLGALSAEATAVARDVLFLQTMQDLRAQKQVPRETLVSMAAYYDQLYPEGDTASFPAGADSRSVH